MLGAGRLLQFRPGKPSFNLAILQTMRPDDPQLYEFAGQRSWLMFHLLNLDVGWMQLDPGQWAQDLRFLCFQSYKENLAVVNDAAERAVKDVVEFATNSQDTPRRNDMIKVVNSHRELFDFETLNKIAIADINWM